MLRVEWIFTGVYGPSVAKNKDALWKELGAVRNVWAKPWVVGGNFNVIRFLHEKSPKRVMNKRRGTLIRLFTIMF